MTATRRNSLLEIGKLCAALAGVVTFAFYAGKLDEKTAANTADIATIRQDIKDIKAVIYQPVMREAQRDYRVTKNN